MSKRLPPLNALHTFAMTAQYKSFTQAADAMHLTQGAVSRQIAALEDHLGYPLFQRHARGLVLTAQGAALAAPIQQAFAQMADAVERVSAKHNAIRMKTPTCAMRWLLPRLMRFQAAFPDLPVELTTTVHHGVDFQAEDFDIAVVFGNPPGRGVNAHRLFRERMTPVCAPSLLAKGPLTTPQDLAHYTLLHPTRDQRDWQLWLAAAGCAGFRAAQSQHFDTLDLATTAAVQGFGVAIGDWSLIGEDVAAGRLVTPFPLRVETGAAYYLVHPERSAVPPRLQTLIDWLTAEAAETDKEPQ